jgi:DNA methylase
VWYCGLVGFRVFEGDCVEVMAGMPEASVDAIVCDPPYELGFMGRKWDSTGVAYQPETWAAALRVLKPGGHLLAFGGTRTYHRMTCAIEDAGFEIRDCLSWLYGSGFPKSHNVGKKLEGWEGWGTALKPANEPIVLARKPFTGTVAANVLEFGTGALNIDGCRIAHTPGSEGAWGVANTGDTRSVYGTFADEAGVGGSTRNPAGRWPANIVLSHGEGCREVCEPGCSVRMLDEQSGERPSTGTPKRPATPGKTDVGGYGDWAGKGFQGPLYSDTGGASRFFYTTKASRKEREAGLEGIRCKCDTSAKWVNEDQRAATSSGQSSSAGNACPDCGGVIEGGRVNAHP